MIDSNLKISYIGNRHIKKIHESNKPAKPRPYKCTICADVSFTQKANLKIHIASVHEGKRHKCSLCQKTYATEAILATHIETLHVKSQLFQCKQCEVTFSTKGSLRYHAEVCEGKPKPKPKPEEIFYSTGSYFPSVKGQLISECPSGVVNWTKRPMNFFKDFCPSL